MQGVFSTLQRVLTVSAPSVRRRRSDVRGEEEKKEKEEEGEQTNLVCEPPIFEWTTSALRKYADVKLLRRGSQGWVAYVCESKQDLEVQPEWGWVSSANSLRIFGKEDSSLVTLEVRYVVLSPDQGPPPSPNDGPEAEHACRNLVMSVTSPSVLNVMGGSKQLGNLSNSIDPFYQDKGGQRRVSISSAPVSLETVVPSSSGSRRKTSLGSRKSSHSSLTSSPPNPSSPAALLHSSSMGLRTPQLRREDSLSPRWNSSMSKDRRASLSNSDDGNSRDGSASEGGVHPMLVDAFIRGAWSQTRVLPAQVVAECTTWGSALCDMASHRCIIYALSELGTPGTVMELLVARVRALLEAQDEASVAVAFRFLTQWAVHQPQHFREAPSVSRGAGSIFVTAGGPSLSAAVEASEAVGGSGVQPSPPPAPVVSAIFLKDDESIVSLQKDQLLPPPSDLVRAWSALDLALLRVISAEELIAFSFDSGVNDSDGKSSSIPSFAAYFNAGTCWLASRIMERSALSEQSEAISWLIQVASLALARRNFSLCLQALMALSMPAVLDLVDAWAAIPREALVTHRRLADVFSEDCLFSSYYEALGSDSSPAIPLISLLLAHVHIIKQMQPPDNFGSVSIARLKMLGAAVGQVIRLLKFYSRDFPCIVDDEALTLRIREKRSILPLKRLTMGLRASPAVRVSMVQIRLFQTLISRPFGSPVLLEFSNGCVSEREWAIIFSARFRIPFFKGEVLLRRGATPEFLTRIVAGTCRVEISGLDVALKALGHLGPKSLFGVSSLVNPREETAFASVLAESDGLVDVAPCTFVRELCVQSQGLGGRVFASVCVELARSLQMLEASYGVMRGGLINVLESPSSAERSPTTLARLSSGGTDVSPRLEHGPANLSKRKGSSQDLLSEQGRPLPPGCDSDLDEVVVSIFERVQLRRKLQGWTQGVCYLSQTHFYFLGFKQKKLRISLTEIERCFLNGAELSMNSLKKKWLFRYNSGTDWRQDQQDMRSLYVLVEPLRVARQSKALHDGNVTADPSMSPSSSDPAPAVSSRVTFGESSQRPDPSQLSLPLSRPAVFRMEDGLWSAIWASARLVSFCKGDTVVNADTTTTNTPVTDEGRQPVANRFLYRVISGSCDLLVDATPVGRAVEGDLFGEVALLLEEPLGMSVVAAAEVVTLLRLEGSVLRAALSINSEMQTKFYFWLASQLCSRVRLFLGKARQTNREQSPKNSFLERLNLMAREFPPPGSSEISLLPSPSTSLTSFSPAEEK